jgi:hypothetical protein
MERSLIIIKQALFAGFCILLGVCRLAMQYVFPRLIQLIAVLIAKKLIP